MKTEICAELTGNGRSQPVFEGLQIKAELRETLAITTITQSYRNPGSKNIEAVYTFPLPLDAVLLEMTVTVGDKTLKGTVLPKHEAEEKYEEAITDGDAPVMLQNPQPGVYTMNIGNLLPKEKASITIRYGMFERWQGGTLRYHLPTTIAPRYGSAEKAGLELHQEPETSILAENLFSFELKVFGSLAAMCVSSPSHEIVVERNVDGRESVVTLLHKTGFMDRDLIITVQNSQQQSASALLARDGDKYLLWGSFKPQFSQAADAAPRSVKIVVDCSGSMGGDSIAQAREALLRVLDELRPQDWFNIVAFGSTATPLFNAQSNADQESLSYARGFLKKLDADMGGTEIGSALAMAVRLRCPDMIEQDVLLITDGEVWEWEKIVDKAVKSKHRFFTVGVGSSVSEAFVRMLADRTSGACELVSLNENMAERIHRHFKRIGTPRSSRSEVVWPVKPLRVFPEVLPSIYDGDTCNVFAWFGEAPVGEIQLKISLKDNSERVLSAGIGQAEDDAQDSVIPRMAAALKLREISEEKAGQELAVKYQLVSRWTNYLAIVVRNEAGKAESLPELHKVQQMLAAGWGGTGSVRYCLSSPCQKVNFSDIPTFIRRDPDSRSRSTKAFFSMPSIDLLNEVSSDYSPNENQPVWIWEKVSLSDMDRFMEMLELSITSGTMPTTIHLPLLPASIETALELLVKEGFEEKTVVTVFLHHLAGSAAGARLSRQAKRVITKEYKKLGIDSQTAQSIEERLKNECCSIEMDEDELDVPTFLRKGTDTVVVP